MHFLLRDLFLFFWVQQPSVYGANYTRVWLCSNSLMLIFYHILTIIVRSCLTKDTVEQRSTSLDTEQKLNVHKTFRRFPECILNVLWTFNLRLVSGGIIISKISQLTQSAITCSKLTIKAAVIWSTTLIQVKM